VSLKAGVAGGHSLVLGRDEIEDSRREEGRFLNKSGAWEVKVTVVAEERTN